jgi:hypothetical protein
MVSFSPNPVYRNHPSDRRWYLDAYLQELNGVGATLQRRKTLWITEQGQVQDQMEESVDIVWPMRAGPFPGALGFLCALTVHPSRSSHKLRHDGTSGEC